MKQLASPRSVVLPLLALLGVAVAPAARAQGPNRNDAQYVRQAKDALVAFERAAALTDAGDRDGAFDSLEMSFAIVPDFPEARFLRARLLYANGEYTRALLEIRCAEEGHARFVGLRDRMKSDWARMLRSHGARYTLERDGSIRPLLQTAPPPEPVPARYSFLHGNILLRLGRLGESVARYEAALAVEPEFGDAANNLASVYHAEGEHAKAMEVVITTGKRGAVVLPELKRSIEEALGGNL